ncbi:hypothetical protein TRV_01892 [Trichophyton verrucosum HKI 0517]|uniref:Aminoglycoside phosphotransferase domain-containing protein n=1 Tax=Trichophyton verrucosum (strain HKI 0517) TaxID=663202 RepID=D4D478_TRIVH|nr:uncharacterized protein TRV_01892 [Trichophyton verrucosum HKI 0517]EFE43333.1 hypothetical protein TRV_01892 [Trichophyton verrucosum HKI 0517]
MKEDNEACLRNDSCFISWLRYLRSNNIEESACKLASHHVRREATSAEEYLAGSFNRCYRVKFKDGPDVLVRFPALGRSMFRREKIVDEITVMEYVEGYTSIPVPRALGYGATEVGPYMILEFVEGKLLSGYLKASEDPKVPSTLKLDLDPAILRRAYRTMAEIVLQLSTCRFPEIGGIFRDRAGYYEVRKRALTLNMNELVALANFPPKRLSQRRYADTTSYLVSLANDHLHHLETQRNDAVVDEEDCRKKYIARCLFREVARRFRSPHDPNSFPLFCEDLRPSNVIVDEELRVRAVIDWEFCYAAPAEFTYCPPWWLLLCRPENWEAGFDDFLVHYMARLEIFLEELREYEVEFAEGHIPPGSSRLSEHMAQSIENGNLWIFLAATYSFGFDDIYWKFIHPKYYGDFGSTEDLLKLLNEEDRKKMDDFVQGKMQQMKEGGLDSHRTIEEITDH